MTFKGKKRHELGQQLVAFGVANVKNENILFNRDNLKDTGKKQSFNFFIFKK
jgi:hypothetical protein